MILKVSDNQYERPHPVFIADDIQFGANLARTTVRRI